MNDLEPKLILSDKDKDKYSILFLDDEKPIISSLHSLLRKEKFTKNFFTSSDEALRFLHTNHVDLIVSDMRMPGMSGKDFLILAKDLAPDSIKIILSGFEEKPLVLDMISNGIAHYYLMKPWNDEELIRVFNKFCNLNFNLQNTKLRQNLNSFSKLPAPNHISAHLISLVSSFNVNINAIVEELEYHPFLVTKILQFQILLVMVLGMRFIL